MAAGWDILCIYIVTGGIFMHTKLQKWGNSQGIRINRNILEDSGLSPGDEVDVTAEEGKIIIRPSQRRKKKYRLDDLVQRTPKNYRSEEVDWGTPKGREIW